MVDAQDLDTLRQADQRAVRSVDSLAGEQWREPSLLPRWSRAHVVAHLALNAEGFARALGGVQDCERVAIYDSNEARDAAIEELAAEHVDEIRDRFFGATTRLRHLFGSLTDEQWGSTVDRLPEGPAWPVTGLVEARLREVEIHHADLGLTYSAADWPLPFAASLLDRTTPTHAELASSGDFTVRATDVDRTWRVGADSPVVTGTVGALAWWLVGRGSGEGLTCDNGTLPQVGPWVKPVSPR